MTQDQIILSHRLSLLSRAKSINNISKACRELGVSRTYYYKWQKRYLAYGIYGLTEKPKTKPLMPNKTRSHIVDKILAFIKIYPTYGLARIANELGNVRSEPHKLDILLRQADGS